MEKIIFLDIDGVLNHQNECIKILKSILIDLYYENYIPR